MKWTVLAATAITICSIAGAAAAANDARPSPASAAANSQMGSSPLDAIAVIDSRNGIVGRLFAPHHVLLRTPAGPVIAFTVNLPSTAGLEWGVSYGPTMHSYASSDCSGTPLIFRYTVGEWGAKPSLQAADVNGDVWLHVGMDVSPVAMVARSRGYPLRPGRSATPGTVNCVEPNQQWTVMAYPLEQSINLSHRYPEPLRMQ